jgi:hypothetical protein
MVPLEHSRQRDDFGFFRWTSGGRRARIGAGSSIITRKSFHFSMLFLSRRKLSQLFVCYEHSTVDGTDRRRNVENE